MTLCQNCRKFDIQAFGADPDQEYAARGIPFFLVSEGVNAGCNFCTFLYESFKKEDPYSIDDARLGACFYLKPVRRTLGAGRESQGMGLGALDVRLVNETAGLMESESSVSPWSGKFVRFRIAADPGTPAAISKDVLGPIPRDDPLCETFIDDMKRWLRTCTENHTQCSRSISGQPLDNRNSQLPTRCLKVDGMDGSRTLKYHLEETTGWTGCYLTLSHRWDDTTETSKTVVQNYRDRLAGKAFNLPKLFRDTLLLAFKLNIAYVWIDSVCIIQDGNEWETESLKMADYYQQSICTLAAAMDTADNGLGLSKIPRELMPRLARLPYRDRLGHERGHIFIYQSVQNLFNSYMTGLGSADLLTRGWVFQEWCLSRRNACFVSDKPGKRIFFHCQSERPRNEAGDVVIIPDISDVASFFGKPVRFTGKHPPSLWEQWGLAVLKYSTSDLTKPDKDRIIALAGVAKECRQAIRVMARSEEHRDKDKDITPTIQLDTDNPFFDAYVAGIWLTNVHDGLLWAQNVNRAYPRRRVLGMPTWSWASILVPVSWPRQSRAGNCCCRLLSVTTKDKNGIETETTISETKRTQTEPREPHAFDLNTKYAILRLAGRVFPVQAGGDLAKDEHEGKRLMREIGFPGLDASAYGDWRNLLQVRPPGSHSPVCGWCSLEHPDFQHPVGTRRVDVLYALPISRYTDGESGDTQHTVWNILLMREVPQCSDRRYERVGMGRVFGPHIKDKMQTVVETEVLLH